MKCFLSSRRVGLLTLAVSLAAISALAQLPSWIRNIEAGTAIESAFFRAMTVAGTSVFFRRPPGETRTALEGLIKAQPHNAELYSLRAMEDEQQLDFTAAESDWKAYLNDASDKADAEFALADFYHRRVRPQDEIKTLALVATAPPISSEKLVASPQQRSWQAFERIFTVIQAQRMSKEVSIFQYRAWIARYPAEQSLYARFLQFLVEQKEYAAAGQLIADYRKQFPNDQVFPVRANAMVEYRRGSVREGLAVYEQSFQPLWNPELVKSYFDLLRDTRNLRKFRDDAHAALVTNPEDLNATARLFYYYQQQGKTEVAQQVIADLLAHKEANKSAWTSQELYTCARLLEEIHAYPESARYYFALYNSKGMPDAQEVAIAGLTGILLTAPETTIRFGSGDLSMYRDIATMDQGPGYLNGILSLILNTTHPASQYSEEEQRAVPYFHRSRAVELLALLDSRFPNSSRRSALHEQILEFYANSGESDAVVLGGKEFLANFPNASERTSVALLMADAYARQGATESEFAIYDSVLKELAGRAQNVPLGVAGGGNGGNAYGPAARNASDESAEEGDDEAQPQTKSVDENVNPQHRASDSFRLESSTAPNAQTGPRSPEYARVLERYLARLAETRQVLPALAVLRREIDRNPDDPGLYERLAVFVEQNQLGGEQEEVYKRAIARFQDKSWYDKLARFYLRQKRNAELEQLTRQAVKTFSGSDLERYFDNVNGGSPALYLRLNQYAHLRFPHNPVFVRNLLAAYQSPSTRDLAAWETLLRQHWFEEPELRDEFFEFLSRRGTLASELSAIRHSVPDSAAWEKNPAAATFLAYGDLWRSHFESSAPVFKALARMYPAEREIANTASSVYRSLAYFDPTDTEIAVQIEENLLRANPGDTELMARIGDTYADRNLFAKAAPYWERIPQVAPGQSSGYLDAATIYWDYFDFDNAVRLLTLGRDRLRDPNLYAYEEGAIYENKRDYPRAIDDYMKGALGAPGSSAESRLLELARRPRFHDLVDQATQNAVAGAAPTMTAINVRVSVLETQNRKQELATFLDSIVSRTNSIEQAEDIERLAQQKSLEDVRQHALEKQASLTTDPVNRLQLRYSLIQLYESRKQFEAAQKNVEALYRENSKILGVVRSTVDFYWRMKMQSQAIDVLRQAAKDAYPDLSRQFSFEAARKMTEAKRFREAQDELAALLKDSPYNGEYLAAMADTYAQAGDDPGLQQFYLDKIAFFRADSTLSSDARKAQIATLRRGLIPSLTRMKNYAGAVDQYIELINNFPEDDSLTTEAALYALRYQRQQQLADFYVKTVAKSPRDYRWSMVLARIQTNLEDYPAAIETYTEAVALRPDRSDLFIVRAGLEERLMRFDDAAKDYEHIYQLTYNAPRWMEKVAAVRAREGKPDQTVAALEAALITGRPENPSNYFEVARRLEGWGMLPQARSFADKGVKAAGTDLLTSDSYQAGVKEYVRIMTRLREYQVAYETLQAAFDGASANLSILKEQVAKLGMAGMADSEWRENTRRIRTEAARRAMTAALEEMGSTENAYFTPEERLTFAHFAESKRSGMSSADVERFAIPLAESGALSYQEALWRYQVLMERGAKSEGENLQRYITLQRQRGLFSELAGNLERYAATVPPVGRYNPLVAAADAYRSSEDQSNELRVLQSVSLNELDNGHQQRLFKLLLARQPKELVRIASTWNVQWGGQAASYVVANGGTALSHEMVDSRSKTRPVVWNKAYNSLVGLYYADPSADVKGAFAAALGNATIGDRIGKPVNRDQQLAGNAWFYYGSRYGEYLGATKQDNPEDYLPSVLEESPASESGYLILADYYAASGDFPRAIVDYNHALELGPNRPSAIDSLAVALYHQGDHAAAFDQWKRAFRVLSNQLNSSHMPESFWADFGRTCDQLAARKLFNELKPDAEAIVRTYLRHNGNYRSNAILHSVYSATGDPAAATAWIISLSTSADDPAQVLSDIADASWIPLPKRGAIYQNIIDLKRNAAEKLTGAAHDEAEQDLASWQVRWIAYLIRAREYSQAAAAIQAMPKAAQNAHIAELIPLQLLAAAQLGTLDAKITEYREDPANAPADEIIRDAARKIFDSGDKQSARKLLEYAFAREIEEHKLNAANFLGLAEIRLASGDTAGALDLLHRLVIVVGNPLENLDPAAALLEKTGHNAEAIEFLEELVKSAPWDASYRVRLAKAQVAAGKDAAEAQNTLASIAASTQASYAVRIQAASALENRSHPGLGSAELNLLAGPATAVTAVTADKFYFYESRILAAQNVGDPHTRLQLLTHCVTDFPLREEARVPLFRAASSVESNELAIAMIEPLTQGQFLRQEEQPDSEEDIVGSADTEDDGDEGTNFDVAAAMTSTRLTRAQQAELAQQIADVMVRLDRLDEALSYYQTARSLETGPTSRKAILGKMAAVKSKRRLRQQNAAREPVFHEALEQDRMVRPRLVARMNPSPAATSAKGAVKQ